MVFEKDYSSPKTGKKKAAAPPPTAEEEAPPLTKRELKAALKRQREVMYGGTPTRSRSSSPSTDLSLSRTVRNGGNRKNAVAFGPLGALNGGGGVGEAANIASLKIAAAAAAVHASALASHAAAEVTDSNNSSGSARLTSSTTASSSTSTVLADRHLSQDDEQYVKSILSGLDTRTHQPSCSSSHDKKGAPCMYSSSLAETSAVVPETAPMSVTEEMTQLQPAICPSPSHLKEEIKMVLCVRKDLKMGVGKMCAQCAHAAVAATQYCCSSKVVRSKDARTRQFGVWYALWDGYCGSKKVTVAIPDLATMDEVTEKASTLGVPYFVVRDAGRTQVEAGSATVVAVGPAPSSLVDKITGTFRLL